MTQDANTLQPADDADPNAVPGTAGEDLQDQPESAGAPQAPVDEDEPPLPHEQENSVEDEEGLIAEAKAKVELLAAEAAAFAAGAARKIVAFAEHEIQAVGAGPRTIEAAHALPAAAPSETLFHVAEDAAIRAFMDVDNQVKHVFLNALGHHVKAVI